MSLFLKVGEICQYRKICPYNKYATGADICWGARSERDCNFVCDFVIDGKIQEGFLRNPLDKTGQMKILID